MCDPGEIAPFKANRGVYLEAGDLAYISALFQTLRHRRLANKYYKMGVLDGRKLEWGAESDMRVLSGRRGRRKKFPCVMAAVSVDSQASLIL